MMPRSMHGMRGARIAGLTLALALLSPLAQAGEAAGTLAWGQRLDMGPLVSGEVAQIKVRPGQRVKRGDLLLSLEGRGFRAQLAAAQAQAKHLGLVLEEAQREDERADELYERTVLSETERTQTTIALAQAEAAAQRAQAAVTDARLALKRSQLRAPFDGIVLALQASVGQSVVSTQRVQPLLVLAGDKQMQLQLNVNARTAAEIAAASALRVQLGEREIAADHHYLSAEPVGKDGAVAIYRLHVSFPRPSDLNLRAGAAARLLW